MRYEVVFAPEADDQLEALFLYIAGQNSVLVAERYTSAIIATCEDLAMFPQRGAPRDDIRPGLRVTHHKGRAIIAYAIDEVLHRVTVMGVYYGGQDYELQIGAADH